MDISVTASLASQENIEILQEMTLQDRLRPVTKLKRIPDMPQMRGDRNWVWWVEQVKRCRYGWTCKWVDENGIEQAKHLNGFQYFYLNFVKLPIQDKKTGGAIWKAPLFRDNDEIIFGYLWRNRWQTLSNGTILNARNHIEAKCRSIGWTQITLLGVAMWTFIFKPDRPIGIGYCDDDVIHSERIWFTEAWAKMPAFFRSYNGQMLKVRYNNKDVFEIGYIDKDTNTEKTHNRILFEIIGSEMGAGVFKGTRLNLIIAVEAGKWPGNTLKKFHDENLDCLESGIQKWGMFFIGGTSNVIINKSSNYKEMFYSPKTYNATTHFTSKVMVLDGYYDENTGISDTNCALQHIQKTRKSKEGDSQSYQQYIIENPLTVEECFTPNQSFAYDTAKILAQIGHIKGNGIDVALWFRARLDYAPDAEGRPTKRIKIYPDKNGKWLINRQGLPDRRYKNLHIAALDDTYKGAVEKDLRKKDSRNCMVIYRQPTSQNLAQSDMPCAIYLHQTEDMDDIYEDCLMGLKLWDVSQCIYEHNHDGFVNYLKHRYQQWRLYQVGTKWGLKVTPRVKTELTALGHSYFKEERYKNITSVELLEALQVWGGNENTDMGSAFHLILWLLDQTKDRSVTKRADEETGETAETRRVILGMVKETVEKMVGSSSSDDYSRHNRGSERRRGEEKQKRGRIKLGPR